MKPGLKVLAAAVQCTLWRMRFAIAVLAFVVLTISSRAAHADDLADARTFIGKQVELIKKGDLEGLKATLTGRLQGKVSKDQVDKAAKEADKYSLDDLVGSVSLDGHHLKIKTKNGRALTSLTKVDGAWRADTIWFK